MSPRLPTFARLCAVAALSTCAALLTGCGSRPAPPPTHAAVVCVGRDCGERAAERAAAFEAWARPALHRKGSTFDLWELTGPAPRRAFQACIPDHWGGHLSRAMAAFLREGHGRAAQGGDPLPAGCGREQAPEAPVLLLDQGRRVLLRAAGPLQFAVVCDRSDSMLGLACDEARLRPAFDDWLARSGAAPGSSFTLVGVGGSRDTAEILLRAIAPEAAPAERVAHLLAARAGLAAALDRAPAQSAIAEAVSVAAEELARRPGPRELLVMSDLRQVSRSSWNFEVAAPPPERFVRWLSGAQLLPRLDAAVAVCGQHHRRAPGAQRFDARLANAVQVAWAAAFAAMGAARVELRAECGDGLGGPGAIAVR